MNSAYQRNNMAYNRGGPGGTREQRIEEGNLNLMEQENNAKWQELGDQVSLLKNLSLEINQEVDSQNSMLSGMGDNFSNVGQLFENTIGKMTDMLTKGGGCHMYHLVVFIVLIFFVLYFFMRK